MQTLEKKVWTYDDYLKLPDDKRYEIIKGEIHMSPAPTTLHQLVLMTLYKTIDSKLNNEGVIFIAPTDLVLSEKDVVQPDLMIISKSRKEMIKERGIFGSPDLVVEIISKGSLSRDLEIKRKLYAEHKIKEYWIVFPKEEFIEIFSLEGTEYVLYKSSDDSKMLCSKVFKNLCVDVEKLFKSVKKIMKEW